MNILYKAVVECRCQYHWTRIKTYRERIRQLVDGGHTLDNPELICLSAKLDQHGRQAFVCEDVLAC